MNTSEDPRSQNDPDGPDRPTARFSGPARIVVPVVALLLVGGGVALALDHNSGSTASAGNAAGFGTPGSAPGANGRFGPPGSGGQGPPGRGSGVAGERHVQGTVTAKTASTVTVKSSSGTATYTVNATSEIVRDGQGSTLAAVKVGDPVLVHVFPSSSGQMLVERLFAGTMPGGGGPGFGPPGSGAPPSSSGAPPTITS